MAKKKSKKKITVDLILSWAGGILGSFFGVVLMLGNLKIGVLMIAVSLLLIPNIRNFLKKLDIHVSKKILMFIGIILIPALFIYGFSTSEFETKNPCTPNWNCSEWSTCNIEGEQTRTCLDLNQCNPTNIQKTETQNCEACKTNWDCGEWSECEIPGIQTRSCSDLNECAEPAQKTEERECEILLNAGDILDIADSVPTEFVRKDSVEIPNEDVGEIYKSSGYVKAYKRSFTRVVDLSFVELKVISIEYSTKDDAKKAYDATVTLIVEKGGYTEKTIRTDSECFGVKSSAGFYDITKFYCINRNILFIVSVADGEYDRWSSLAGDIVKGIDDKFF